MALSAKYNLLLSCSIYCCFLGIGNVANGGVYFLADSFRSPEDESKKEQLARNLRDEAAQLWEAGVAILPSELSALARNVLVCTYKSGESPDFLHQMQIKPGKSENFELTWLNGASLGHIKLSGERRIGSAVNYSEITGKFSQFTFELKRSRLAPPRDEEKILILRANPGFGISYSYHLCAYPK